MTRHARHTPAKTRPFDSFEINVWINFSITYIALVAASIAALAAFKNFKGNWKIYDLHWSLPLVLSILSPEFHDYERFLKFAILLELLLASIGGVFYNLYNMELRAVLVNQTFEQNVEGWEQMDFFRTKFYYIFDDLTTGKI